MSNRFTHGETTETSFVSVKVSRKTHDELRNLKFEFKVERYPEVIDRLVEEHFRQSGEKK